MGTRHVTDLFSAAYDDALTPAERRRYDDHLATCPDCATGAEQFRKAIDAVHALPAASMPHRVVLPADPPQVERRTGLRLPVLSRLPRPGALGPMWGAGAMVAVGLAAVVIVVHAHSGVPSPSSTNSAPAPAAGAAPNAKSGTGGGAAQAAAPASLGACPLPLAVVPQSASVPAPPDGFGNSTVATVPERPGQELVLATTSTSVAPGSRVLIYAALTATSGQRTAVIPCVTLHDQGAVALSPGSAAGSDRAAALGTPTAVGASPEYASSIGSLLTPAQLQAFAPYTVLPWIAAASPTAAAVANLPLQVLQIPANATPGTHLQLVALVPSGLPNGSDQPAIEAVLTLDVS